jgi:hypothetical protein
MRCLRFLALIALLPTPLFAWGSKGHSIVAEIAERGLTPNTAAQIRALNFAAPLRDIASMPDDWRAEETKGLRTTDTGAMHYANTPNEIAHFDRARDCKEDKCVVAAVEKYAAILKDKTQSRDARREALIYLVHFVGDLHQPMHAAGGKVRNETTGEMEMDRGGNLVKIRFFGVETNLHSAWDSMVIDYGPRTVDDYVEHLLTFEMRGRPIEELQRGTVTDWFNESHYAAVNDAYVIGDGRLGGEYAQKNIGIVYERLLRGGLRLRKILEESLNP